MYERCLTKGRGERATVVAMNLLGWFMGVGLVKTELASPTLARMVFESDSYSNIDRGYSCEGLSNDVWDLTQLLVSMGVGQ